MYLILILLIGAAHAEEASVPMAAHQTIQREMTTRILEEMSKAIACRVELDKIKAEQKKDKE